MVFQISTASDSEQVYDNIRAVTTPEAVNQVWKTTYAPPADDDDETIMKCSEFAGLLPNPCKLYMVKNFLPHVHLACRFNGDYSRFSFQVTFEPKAINIYMDDVLVFQVIDVSSCIGRRLERDSHKGYSTINKGTVSVFTKLSEFDNTNLRSFGDNAIEVTALGSKLASENFSLKAFIILDDRVYSKSEDLPQIEDDMVNQLQWFCTEMPDLCNCPNPREIQCQDSLDNGLEGLKITAPSYPLQIRNEWKLLGTVDGLVNQFGAIYLDDSEPCYVDVSQKPNDVMKPTVFYDENQRVEINSYLTKSNSIDQENEFMDCQADRISTNQIRITYHTSGFSFVTELITNYDLRPECEVLGPFFKGNVAIVSLKYFLEGCGEVVIASSLSK